MSWGRKPMDVVLGYIYISILQIGREISTLKAVKATGRYMLQRTKEPAPVRRAGATCLDGESSASHHRLNRVIYSAHSGVNPLSIFRVMR